MKKDHAFKASLWSNESDNTGKYQVANLRTYYCTGEERISQRQLCINLPDGGQVVVNTNSLIKLLKNLGRI